MDIFSSCISHSRKYNTLTHFSIISNKKKCLFLLKLLAYSLEIVPEKLNIC